MVWYYGPVDAHTHTFPLREGRNDQLMRPSTTKLPSDMMAQAAM